MVAKTRIVWSMAMLLLLSNPVLLTGQDDIEEKLETLPIPLLVLSAERTTIPVNGSSQLSLIGMFPNGVVQDLTLASDTEYEVGNQRVMNVSPDGLTLGLEAGFSLVMARSNGFIVTLGVRVFDPNDKDGDLLPLQYEVDNGLSDDDALDALDDLDGDRLDNRTEFMIGTNPRSKDTDGDGLSDAEENRLFGTNPIEFSPRLDGSCKASVLNRTAIVGPTGSFTVPNVPGTGGVERIRITCERDGMTLAGQSAFFRVVPGAVLDVRDITLGLVEPIPDTLEVTPSESVLTSVGATTQLTVTGRFADGSSRDLTLEGSGTTYVSSNPRIAVVENTPGGLVRAAGSGTALIAVRNQGVLTVVSVRVELGLDADQDGLPDDFEAPRPCLNVGIADAGADPDGDGLTNIAEFQGTGVAGFSGGTEPCVADTDGDGLTDGTEAGSASSPVLADTDLDGLADGAEPAGDFDGDGLANVRDSDGDNDGLPDGLEVRICGTPFCADPLADNDGDGLRNIDEVGLFTDPLAADTDQDGLTDADEVLLGTDPLVPDSTPPTVALVAPAPGADLVRADTIAVRASASDDGRVARVDFLLDGMVVASDSSAQPMARLLLPADQLSVDIEVVAVDTNGNTARSGAMAFALVPDPLTEVTGRVRDEGGTNVAGARASVRLPAILVEESVASIAGGAAPIDPGTGAATSNLSGSVGFEAGGEVLGADLVDLEPAGVLDVTGTLLVDMMGFNPQSPTPVSSTLSIVATHASGLRLLMRGPLPTFVPATGTIAVETCLEIIEFSAGGLAGALPLEGQTQIAHLEGSLTLDVDPATGEFRSLALTADLTHSVRVDLSALTGVNGDFLISGVPTIYGDILVDAEIQLADGGALKGISAPVPPVRSGTTSVGDITIAPPSAVTIFPYPAFHVGRAPYSVVAGDFNGDGIGDMAVANFSSSDVSVLRGNGDGAFGPQVRLVAPVGAIGIVAVDLNGDGRQDLATANQSSSNISVFRGNGDGTFQNGTFQTRLQYPAGTGPISIVGADFNQDGRQDLVTANRDSNDLSLLLGNGDMTFRPQIRIPLTGAPRAVTVGDVNEDGRFDLVVANVSSDDVAVLLGNGNGTFGPAARFPAGDGPTAVALADLDLDGHLDAAVANFNSDDVSLLMGNGDGTFLTQVRVAAGDGPHAVVAGRFDNGPAPDLAVANETSDDISVRLGNGDGSFQAQVRFAGTDFPRGLATGDFDRNRAIDLIVANGGLNHASVMFGAGDGSFTSARRFAVAPQPRGIAAGDFNVDGRIDLAVMDPNALSIADGRIQIRLGNGDGTFQAGGSFGVGRGPNGVATGDFNGDGKLDLVGVNRTSADVSVLLGNGNGTFAAELVTFVGQSPLHAAVADFNKDGKADLVVAMFSSAGVRVLLGNGNGTFAAGFNITPGVNFFNHVTVGDFNGDGNPDVAGAGIFTDAATVVLGNGDGTFGPAIFYPAGRQPESVEVGDFNADGRQDLAVANFLSGDVSVLLGNGNGTFATQMRYPAGDQPWLVAVGDFDRNGRDDLAVSSLEATSVAGLTDDVGILLSRSNGSFSSVLPVGVGQQPFAIAVADYNGDSQPDLAVSCRATDNVYVLLNQAPWNPQATPLAEGSAPCPGASGEAPRSTHATPQDPHPCRGDKPPLPPIDSPPHGRP